MNYNGYVTDITEVDANADNIRAFTITIRPWLWLLSFNRTNRIFQGKSVKDILTELFDGAGFKGQYKFGNMPSTQREYCTQYNETDLAFAKRIMAEAGVIFFSAKTVQSIRYKYSRPIVRLPKTAKRLLITR